MQLTQWIQFLACLYLHQIQNRKSFAEHFMFKIMRCMPGTKFDHSEKLLIHRPITATTVERCSDLSSWICHQSSRHWVKTTNVKFLTNSLTWVVTQHGTAVWTRQVAGVEMSDSGLWRLRSRNWQLLVSQVNTHGSSSFCSEGGNPLCLPPTSLHEKSPKI